MQKAKCTFVAIIAVVIGFMLAGCEKSEPSPSAEPSVKQEETVAETRSEIQAVTQNEAQMQSAASEEDNGVRIIQLDKYVNVAFTGYNGYGEAEVSFTPDFNGVIVDTLYERGVIKEYSFNAVLEKAFISTDVSNLVITSNSMASIDKTSGLANGDEVTITADFKGSWDEEQVLKEYGKKLKSTEMTMTIEGLVEPIEFDPFEHVEISCSGVSPEGSLSIVQTDKSEPSIWYYFENDNELSQGDEVLITALPNDYSSDLVAYCAKLGYKPTRTELLYTIDGMDDYLSNVSQIAEEEAVRLDEAVRLFTDAEIAGGIMTFPRSTWFKSMDPVGFICLTVKDPSGLYGGMFEPYSYLYMLYSVHLENEGDVLDYYFCYYYRDIIVKPDGSLQFNTDKVRQDNTSFRCGKYAFNTGSLNGFGYTTIEDFYQGKILPKMDEYAMTTNIPGLGE